MKTASVAVAPVKVSHRMVTFANGTVGCFGPNRGEMKRLQEPDGTVMFMAHRNVYVGYINNHIACTRKTPDGVRSFLAARGF